VLFMTVPPLGSRPKLLAALGTDVSTPYGRGFGYKRVVPSSARGVN